MRSDDLVGVRQMLKRPSSHVDDSLPGTFQQNGAVLLGIAFEHRHYEDEPIKALETKYGFNFDTLPRRFRTEGI